MPTAETVRAERANFRHLVFDIAWFGLALAATSRFLTVYAIHLGASSLQLGLIASVPALVLIISASLSAWWVRRYKNMLNAFILPTFIMRLMFLLPALAPLFPESWQPLWLIAAVSIPAITQGISGVVFVVLMRETIYEERMTPLLSRRSLALNIAISIGALAFGVWLESAPFPLNYQVMFVVAFLFALISMWHCLRLRVIEQPVPVPEGTAPDLAVDVIDAPRGDEPKVSPWRSREFLSVLLITAVMYLAYFSIVTVAQEDLVERLGASEGFIALYGMVEVMSGAVVALFTTRIINNIGARATIALAMAFTGVGALVQAGAPHIHFTLITAALSGAGWTAAAMVGVFALLTRSMPQNNMTAYSTAYHQVVGVAMFFGPLIGSALADANVNFIYLLLLGAILRFIAGAVVDWRVFFPRAQPSRAPEPLKP